MVSRKRTSFRKILGGWRLGKRASGTRQIVTVRGRDCIATMEEGKGDEQIHGVGPSNFLDWGGKIREVSLPGERRACGLRLRGSQPNDGYRGIFTSKSPVKKLGVRDKLSKALTGEVAERLNAAVC
jgi:hypothetical protein